MTDHFNYGPRLNFNHLHQQQQLHSTIIPSEYLGDKSGFESRTLPSESIMSANSSSLGSHWKRIDSFTSGKSTQSIPTTISSKPLTIPSSISANTASIPPNHGSEFSKDFKMSSSSSMTSEYSETIHGNSLASLAPSSQILSSLVETTENREMRLCLGKQMEGILELDTILEQTVENTTETVVKQTSKLAELLQNGKRTWGHHDELVDCLEETVGGTVDELEKLEKKLLDMDAKIVDKFRDKEKVEKFVRDHERIYEINEKTINMISENEKRVAKIRQFLDIGKVDVGPLTVFEQEDHRVQQAVNSLVNLIHELPFNKNERLDFNHTIEKIVQNHNYDGKYKFELLTRHLMRVMSNWDAQESMSSLNSDSWMSTSVVSSKGNHLDVFDSSSFALSGLSTDDSSLNDLDDAIRSASIRKAVEGPKGVYECGSWDSASNISQWSTYSDGHSSVQSLREQMSLSSYELRSSSGHSTLSSLSTSSMPDNMSEIPCKNYSTNSMKTAFSNGSSVVSVPPRSFDEKSMLQSATGTRTDSASFNFSSVSLGEIVEDALHTAKDVAETQASHLFDALQNSAQKCGVALSDLMTAVSTSSYSLEETYTSQPKSPAH
ncbi:DUF148 domain-containing protein [Caenorhabditis elegans]|uniref:DUF148 domain-containing protein n=1 Tax=Caenorhabditis elegans TaxID=6239 RepID=Q18340_CAEEL|nr:DUF148 domain-containing protein [Caenorhabditis elegans]CCD64155.2 DUF148 domain-containing protein [Caenorhabditis elegans]|eukprot:NP_500865.3 Uncharacterized protein CELE_C31H1.1 [Caenorhabditis elegans]